MFALLIHLLVASCAPAVSTCVELTSEQRGPCAGAEEALTADELREGYLVIQRGEGLLPLWIPRDERLEFEVIIDLGILGEPTVGAVTLSSGVEPYIDGLPRADDVVDGKAPPREVGWIRSHAQGRHMGYELQHELYTRILPQEWPRVLYRDTQAGTENRRRTLKLGMRPEGLTAEVASDQHCKGCDLQQHFIESNWLWGAPRHCEKCKQLDHRVWKKPVRRTIFTNSVDMLSAIYLARSLVRDGRSETSFILVDKESKKRIKLWEVHLTRGRMKRMETAAGTFACEQVVLKTAVPDGEPHDPDGFEGMFGIKGKIEIWLEAKTGVPVAIQGELPIPVIGDLEVSVQLRSFTGTPPDFQRAR